jgi:hypothetical protein
MRQRVAVGVSDGTFGRIHANSAQNKASPKRQTMQIGTDTDAFHAVLLKKNSPIEVREAFLLSGQQFISTQPK